MIDTIDESIGEKVAITRGISNIIYKINCFKSDWFYSLSPQQKEWLEQSIVPLKKLLAEAVR